MKVIRSGKLTGLLALLAVSVAGGSPGSAYAADPKPPVKKEEKKPAPPAQDKSKTGSSNGNTSDAFKLRGNTGT